MSSEGGEKECMYDLLNSRAENLFKETWFPTI